MYDENKTELLRFSSEIKEDGSLTIPKQRMLEIKKQGFEEIDVVIKGSSKGAAKLNGVDSETFSKIKQIQSLPDTAVLEFFESKGALKNSDLTERVNRLIQ